MTATVALIPSSCNPYRKHSQKHKQFETIIACFQQQHQHELTVDTLTQEGVPPSELWKEARMGHIEIRVQHHASDRAVHVSTYFDNVRSQWTRLNCFANDASDALLCTFEYKTHSGITIYDICRTIEEQCVQYTSFAEESDTWSFLLYDSRNTLLNQTTNMRTKWWSPQSFLHNSHNFSDTVSIVVAPNMLDTDTQHDLGVVGNRTDTLTTTTTTTTRVVDNSSAATHPLTPPAPSGTGNKQLAASHLVQEQNTAYYESLSVDKQKKQHTNRVNPIPIPIPISSDVQDAKQDTSGEEVDHTQPLTREELRDARLQFFLGTR